IGLQVIRERCQEFVRWLAIQRTAATRADGICQSGSKDLDLRSHQWQAMVGFAAGRRHLTFDYIQPAHSGFLVFELALAREISGEFQESGEMSAGEEVGIERDDDVRILKLVLRVNILSEGRSRSRA